VKVRELIELLFGVVSRVDEQMGVLDGSMCPKGRGGLGDFAPHWFEWLLLLYV